MTPLRRGDLLPRVVVPPPGPRSRAAGERLGAAEAPGINTVFAGLPGLVWSEARGSNVVDLDGNRYIDLTSGFGAAAVGHRHPRVLAAIRAQGGRLLHGLGDVSGHPARIVLAERLQAIAPVDDPLVYPAISGADAVEIALKTALLATGRPAILSFAPSYHGLTLGALAATSRPAFRDPFRPRLSHRDVRLPYGCSPERVAETLAARPDLGAVLLEPIVGREGVLLPPPGWLAAIAASCRRHRCLLLADEILTGGGRTGTLFAVEAEGVRPDLLCCGKALGGGLPFAAVIGRREVMERWGHSGEARHTATFVAHPLACVASLAVLDLLESEQLPARARRLEARIAPAVAAWIDDPRVVATRGRGLLWGIELVSGELAGRWSDAARRRGILALAGGPRGAVLELLPPLTITERQLDHALRTLGETLAESLADSGR